MTPRSGALEYLYGLEFLGIKFGLDNISTLVAYLGNPQQKFRTLHIAGTNGKGSVTAMVDAALRAAGYRCARYTSPHLVALNERFVIDGSPVGDRDLDDAINDVRGAVERLRAAKRLQVEPTFFEVTTAVAFELFRRAGVEVAVIEVGLGGRLDATNVVAPLAAAITSIGFDHERYLGSTLREIALEKAGIIKPGLDVVIGDVPAEALDVIAETARARGATLIRAAASALDRAGVVAIGLKGRHQRRNAAVAATLLEVAGRHGLPMAAEAVRTGLATVSWPGRLDLRRMKDGREVLLDAAHNPEGASALAAFVMDTWPDKPPLVFAAMQDKDAGGMLRALLPAIGRLVMTRASNMRAADPAELAASARTIAPALPVEIERLPSAALAAAWRHSPRIVVAGSIFLLGDVLKELDSP
jgi:dihydrofolate synthase/folylpolyglutamate synthase